MGFDAIWISPVVENTGEYFNVTGYHGYWTKDFYGVNEYFGTKQDLIHFVEEAHKIGLWIMVDVVANHVGPVGEDFSQIAYFNTSEFYHENCDILMDDFFHHQTRVQECRLEGLPDLDQDNEKVRTYLIQWIKYLITTFDFDGIRIDTIPHVKHKFWSEFAESAGVFSIGECLDSRVKFIASYQQTASGMKVLDALLNYPLYYAIESAFINGNTMTNLSVGLNAIGESFIDPSVLGNFIDNHDRQRFLYRKDSVTQLKNALTLNFMFEGIPILYYGTEQYFKGADDPLNREILWPTNYTTTDLVTFVKTLNKLRSDNKLWLEKPVELSKNDKFYVFGRGPGFIVALTNTEKDQAFNIPAQTYIPAKSKICNMLGDIKNDCYTLGDDGSLTGGILKGGLPAIYIVQK